MLSSIASTLLRKLSVWEEPTSTVDKSMLMLLLLETIQMLEAIEVPDQEVSEEEDSVEVSEAKEEETTTDQQLLT